MELKKGAKNVVFSVGGQIITLLIGIFIPRLVIVSYGSEVNGLLSSIGAILTYLALLEAGVGTVACQALYKPIANNDKEQINKTLSAASYYYRRTGLLYAGLIVALAVIYPWVAKSELSKWLIGSLVIVCGIPNIINYLFQRKYLTFLEAQGDNYIVVNIQTAITIVASILKIVLLSCGINVIIVQAMYCVTSLAQMIFIYWYIKKRYGWIDLKVEKDFSGLQQKNGALLHQICALITNSTDVLILTLFCPLYVVSIYAVYNMLFNIIYNAVYTVNSSLTFLLGRAYEEGKEQYKKVIDAYETSYITLAASLLTVTYVMTIPFLKLYTAGADINYINVWLPILFLAVKLLNSCRNASLNTISIAGYFNNTTKHAIIESILNVVISVLSVWEFGLIGVLFGTIVAFVYRYIVAVRFANHKILNRKCTHSIRVVLVNIVLTSLLVIVFNLLELQLNNYFILIGAAAGIAVLIVACFVIINILNDRQSAKEILGMLKRKLKKKKDNESIR